MFRFYVLAIEPDLFGGFRLLRQWGRIGTMGNHALLEGSKMTRRAFIIGGTGQIGRAVAARFLADGWQVTLSSRGQRTVPSDLVALGADFVTLDREQPGSIAKALQDGADAVIDTVAYDRYHADRLLE